MLSISGFLKSFSFLTPAITLAAIRSAASISGQGLLSAL